MIEENQTEGKLEDKLNQLLEKSEMKLLFIGENTVKIEGKEKDSSMYPTDLERMAYCSLKFRYVEVGLDNKLIATFIQTEDSKRRFE